MGCDPLSIKPLFPPNRVTCLRCGFEEACGCAKLAKVEAYVADRGMYGGYSLGDVWLDGVRLFYDDGRRT